MTREIDWPKVGDRFQGPDNTPVDVLGDAGDGYYIVRISADALLLHMQRMQPAGEGV